MRVKDGGRVPVSVCRIEDDVIISLSFYKIIYSFINPMMEKCTLLQQQVDSKNRRTSVERTMKNKYTNDCKTQQHYIQSNIRVE